MVYCFSHTSKTHCCCCFYVLNSSEGKDCNRGREKNILPLFQVNSCHFSSISFILEPSFAENISNKVVESFFRTFLAILVLAQKTTILERL